MQAIIILERCRKSFLHYWHMRLTRINHSVYRMQVYIQRTYWFLKKFYRFQNTYCCFPALFHFLISVKCLTSSMFSKLKTYNSIHSISLAKYQKFLFFVMRKGHFIEKLIRWIELTQPAITFLISRFIVFQTEKKYNLSHCHLPWHETVQQEEFNFSIFNISKH